LNSKGGNVKKSSVLKLTCIVFAICAATALTSAQTVTTLATFDITNGADPFAGVVQGADGNFYGTTAVGGSSVNCTTGCGTIYKITPAGTLTTLHSFDGADGSSLQSGLVLATDGNFYGTAYAGGTMGGTTCNEDGYVGCGAVFKITPSGALTTLYNFCSQANCADGRNPASSLVQSQNGDLYGTTNFGGVNTEGTVFKITPAGTLTTLHSFDQTDGYIPNGTLVQASNGSFYGTTLNGGNNACAGGCGTVFKITPSGALVTVHRFSGPDGSFPLAGLALASDGNFYGTTNFGGTFNDGTVFKMSPGGKVTSLYNFNVGPGPYGGLVQGTDGNFYGTTQGGNTVFQITPAGVLTTLFTFNYVDGYEPLDTLVQGTDGNFYATTYQGGDNYGTVFSLAMGLSPFVETNPATGVVGGRVAILGNSLTGTTAVNFNGTSAKFRVVSDTEIVTEVPSGASSGEVTVTTPGSGTLKSNVAFRVLK
jgi:uncharacterized repeat protein (TIGR03803 family)